LQKTIAKGNYHTIVFALPPIEHQGSISYKRKKNMTTIYNCITACIMQTTPINLAKMSQIAPFEYSEIVKHIIRKRVIRVLELVVTHVTSLCCQTSFYLCAT